MLVYAYERGGAAGSGLVAVVQLVPAALFAPFGAGLGDRFPRDRVLLAGYGLQAATTAATAAALAFAAPVPLVYLLAATAATSLTLVRPAQNGLLPSLVATPDALTAANAALGTIENGCILAGPALAGALLAIWGPALVFTVTAAALVAGALSVAGVRVAAAGRRGERVAGGALGAFRVLARDPGALALVVLLGAQQLQVGALDVLFVVLALAALGLGEAGVGALNAALGLGGVLGAAWAGGLAGRAGLARWLALGVAAWGLGLVFAGALPSAPAVFALVVAGGAGRSLMDVTGRTLLQRLAAPDVLSRVFGVLEGSSMAALAIGALAAPVLVERLGSAAAFAAIGALLPVLLVIALPALRTADRRARVPERTLAIARRVPFFAALPAPSLERVAEALRPVEARAGSALVSEGERGDRFYVIERGTAAVSIGGRPVRTLGPGDHFGELALLRDAPRSATVRADSDVSLYALGRDEFLAALTAHPASARSAEAAARALQG